MMGVIRGGGGVCGGGGGGGDNNINKEHLPAPNPSENVAASTQPLPHIDANAERRKPSSAFGFAPAKRQDAS
jgi:hypothetical protein